MPVLRITHATPDFDAWKKAFDDDPLRREQSGVRGHRVFRSIEDPNRVWIDLEFDTEDEAVALRARLQELWQRVQKEGLIGQPTTDIVEELEHRQYET